MFTIEIAEVKGILLTQDYLLKNTQKTPVVNLLDSQVWNYWHEKGSYVAIFYYSLSIEGLGRRRTASVGCLIFCLSFHRGTFS